MKINKRGVSLIAIYAILAVLTTLVFVLIPFEKSVASWLAYAFLMLSYMGGLIICWVAFRKAETLKSKFYGFPVYRVGLLYTLVQFIASLILIVISALFDTSYWVSLSVSVIILAVTAIGIIVGDNLRDTVEKIEDKESKVTQTMTNIQNHLADVLDVCRNNNVKEVLSQLLEKAKYSDPVSCDETNEIEEKIIRRIDELKAFVITDDADNAVSCIQDISNLLSSRNRICKTSK